MPEAKKVGGNPEKPVVMSGTEGTGGNHSAQNVIRAGNQHGGSAVGG